MKELSCLLVLIRLWAAYKGGNRMYIENAYNCLYQLMICEKYRTIVVSDTDIVNNIYNLFFHLFEVRNHNIPNLEKIFDGLFAVGIYELLFRLMRDLINKRLFIYPQLLHKLYKYVERHQKQAFFEMVEGFGELCMIGLPLHLRSDNFDLSEDGKLYFKKSKFFR
eukprot:TRINITY_DN2594_c0_g2_i1.p1 TRINITY_DN2594_c0_g2~~TRINITY_DN2594_c0_g2_i1.p1  ORF type:complete len:186 (-),score=20.79 TRINITY_DN2594_c0_g2_i1:62-556(-)